MYTESNSDFPARVNLFCSTLTLQVKNVAESALAQWNRYGACLLKILIIQISLHYNMQWLIYSQALSCGLQKALLYATMTRLFHGYSKTSDGLNFLAELVSYWLLYFRCFILWLYWTYFVLLCSSMIGG
jgi:hypothetical protein